MRKATLDHMRLEVSELDYVASVEIIETPSKGVEVKIITSKVLSKVEASGLLRVVNNCVPAGTIVDLSIKPTLLARVKNLFQFIFKF